MFFTLEKIEKQIDDIRQAVVRERLPIPEFKAYFSDCPDASRPDFDDREWQDFRVGERWGGYDCTAWFRARIRLPEAWRQRKVFLRFLVGPRDGGSSTAETLLYVNGSALQGIDVWHTDAWIPPEHLHAQEMVIALNAWSGVHGVPESRHFKLAEAVLIDETCERFYFLAKTLVDSIDLMDENDLRRIRLLQALDQAFHRVNFLRPGSQDFYDSVECAWVDLSASLAGLHEDTALKPRVVGLGHAHIDMAWLWRLKHTRGKAARTFATALHLMRQYPDYRFLHSTPQLYKYLKDDHPELYARVKEQTACQAWEIAGGMWVEADTNLTGGESLIRQFLFGRRFARREFGVEMRTLWLPDAFGYSAALPQIARKSGMDHFLTTKISWNQYNRFPHDTFRWRGIDGTELLTHFVTTPSGSPVFSATYNGEFSPREVRGIWDQYRDKGINDELLLLYGWGDGGGGPTREMLETALAMHNLPGMPAVELDTAEAYFERLEKRVGAQRLPVWDGELYLEYHRGTYTSQAQNKRLNRQSETLYHQAEMLASLADILLDQDRYPQEAINAGWEKILLNQFHDILPGSSIHPVYEDSLEDYREIREIGEQAVLQSTGDISRQVRGDGAQVIAYNTLSWERDGLVEMPWSEDLEGKAVSQPDGGSTSIQKVDRDGDSRALLEVRGVPSLGYLAYPLIPEVPEGDGGEFIVDAGRLENSFYCLTLNDRGQITSLYDKRSQREVLPAGERGNVLQAFEDKPLAFDAWDIDIYYREKETEIDGLFEAVVEERGPLRASLRLAWRYAGSTITQRIRLYRSSARIDFHTVVDWHEHQVLLKAAFPVDVRSRRATYDIQFGCLERPTHWNTSWDMARFEVVGHKWADLSEGNYGVSLLNDCKYGYDIHDNRMRLTLIKSGIDPDPMADQGRHEFTYSLLPHGGDWRSGEVVTEAYGLNVPMLAALQKPGQAGCLPDRLSLAQVEAEHVILETVKKAEDGEGAWIVRLYEYKQYRSPAVAVRFALPVRRAVECNLVEEGESPVEMMGDRLVFPIHPFDIKTFKVWF